ncbi:unnamed protein product, partial [Prorocentrum cordatum]
ASPMANYEYDESSELSPSTISSESSEVSEGSSGDLADLADEDEVDNLQREAEELRQKRKKLEFEVNEKWIGHYGSIFESLLKCKFDDIKFPVHPASDGGSNKKLRVLSFCSGTESQESARDALLLAQFFALKTIMDYRGDNVCVDLVASVDPFRPCHRFVWNNLSTDERERGHYYNYVSELSAGEAFCYFCDCCCVGPGRASGCEGLSDGQAEDLDILVAGFPCPPFSTLNSHRQDKDFKFWNHPDGNVIVDIAHWVQTQPKVPPKAIILENVPGAVAVSHKGRHNPLEFLMKGSVKNYKGLARFYYGLKHWGEYDLMKSNSGNEYFEISAGEFGLPVHRKRIFFVLIRKDLASLEVRNSMAKLMKAATQNPMRLETLSDIMMRHNPSSEGDIDLSEEPQRKVNKHYKSKKEGGTWSMTQNSISESMDFREKHGLPEYGSDKMSSITPRRGILPDRERDIIDVIGLMHEKAGGIPEDLTIDVSQSLRRKPFNVNGKIPQLAKGSKIWYRGKILGPRTLFYAMGWGTSPLDFGSDVDRIRGVSLRVLLANMIAKPQIGLVQLALLYSLRRFTLAPKAEQVEA